jgi:hypothetical protein
VRAWLIPWSVLRALLAVVVAGTATRQLQQLLDAVAESPASAPLRPAVANKVLMATEVALQDRGNLNGNLVSVTIDM